MLSEFRLVVGGAVLAAAIGMVDQPWRWAKDLVLPPQPLQFGRDVLLPRVVGASICRSRLRLIP
ncbi:hypothetical protein FOB66_00265 [Roseomonas mucosa]|nr:hypothetical protein FOB66_00265 [Roseomonas mucosa]